MEVIYWLTFLVVIITSFTLKKRMLCIGAISILLIISISIQTELLHNWWSVLAHSADSIEDNKWIADHDGGRAITDLAMIAEAGFTWIVGTIICIFKTKKKETV